MFGFGLGSSETRGVTNRIKLSYRAWKWRMWLGTSDSESFSAVGQEEIFLRYSSRLCLVKFLTANT